MRDQGVRQMLFGMVPQRRRPSKTHRDLPVEGCAPPVPRGRRSRPGGGNCECQGLEARTCLAGPPTGMGERLSVLTEPTFE